MAYGNHSYGSAPIAGEIAEAYKGVIQTAEPPIKKRYLYKIFDSSGNFLTTWNDVVNEPSFSVDINGGYSQLIVQLARDEANYDENVSVDFGNQLKLYEFDRDTPYEGVLIYSGKISRYVPSIIGTKEGVEVTFLSYWWETSQIVVEDGSKTEIVYTTQDPEAILKDILDKHTADGGKLDYSVTSTQTTSTTVSYTFNTTTVQSALLKVLELSPYDWYLRVGADDIIYFKQKSATADHILTLGRHISEYTPEKRVENIINTLYVVGGGSPKLYKKYSDAASVASYGIYAQTYNDGNITAAATAEKVKTRIFANLASPEIRVVLKVMDNCGDAFYNEQGYDIESLQVGDTVQIENATSKAENLWDVAVFDTDAWDYDITNASSTLLQIMRVQYAPDYAIIELSNRQPDIAKRIEEVNAAFVSSQMVDNPDTPS